jgi:hypothetical protein
LSRQDQRRVEVRAESAGRPCVPLHGRSRGVASLRLQVVPDAQFLALEDQRHAGQGEEQAERHAEALGSAHHRSPAAPQPSAIDEHLRIGRERGERLFSFGVGQLLEVELVGVAHERDAGGGPDDGVQPLERVVHGAGRLPGEGEEDRVVQREVEDGVHHRPADERCHGLRRDVGLAHQHDVLPHRRQPSAESREEALLLDAPFEPERGDADDLLEHVGVREIQVGLESVELVVVPALGAIVELPDRVLLAPEHVRVARNLDGLVRPHVVPAVVPGTIAAGQLEPAVPVGGVVDDQVDHDRDAAPVALADHSVEILHVPIQRVDGLMIVDVVSVVATAAPVEGQKPDPRDAERLEMVEAPEQPGEIAEPVSVRVCEPRKVDAVQRAVRRPETGVHDRTPSPATAARLFPRAATVFADGASVTPGGAPVTARAGGRGPPERTGGRARRTPRSACRRA